MLAVGVLIVLGSSAMLVTSHWSTLGPLWKYGLLLAATSGIAGTGRLAHERLLLRRTGTALRSLAVLLWPLTFLALRWALAESELDLEAALPIGLLVANAGLCSMSAGRIFHHFLSDKQRTFEASYLILCVAGVLAPFVPPWGTPVAAFALWLVLVAGIVKVNRHVFWLNEERRGAQILAFLPSLLLGAQFLGLFALDFARWMNSEWMGLGLVLLAVPILATADAVARVFEQRTGDLVRPLPWSIIAPILTALVLCLGGMALAATGLRAGGQREAIVPTAALAAGLLLLVARRTRLPIFAWCGLFAFAVAYNFSPVFFLDTACHLVAQGAHAVREPRLPFAFYGLTYLPLFLAYLGVGALAERRGWIWLAAPARGFTALVSALLLAASWTHPKAVSPVGFCLAALMTVQAALFADRRLVVGLVVAFGSALVGLPAFIATVLGWPVPANLLDCLLATWCAALVVPCARFDRWLFVRSRAAAGISEHLCEGLSLLGTIVFSATFLVRFNPTSPIALAAAAIAGFLALHLWHALYWNRTWISVLTLLFVHASALATGMTFKPWLVTVIEGIVGVLLVQALAARVLEGRSAGRLYAVFGRANFLVSHAGLLLSFVLWVLLFSLYQFEHPSPLADPALWWLLRILIVAWAWDTAIHWRMPWLTAVASLGVLALTAAGLTSVAGRAGYSWLPALWTALALASLPALGWRRRVGAKGDEALGLTLLPLEGIAIGVLVLTSLASLVVLTWPMRIAGVLGVIGLAALPASALERAERRPWLGMLVNWQVISLVAQSCLPSQWGWGAWQGTSKLLFAALPVAYAAAVSLVIWDWLVPARFGKGDSTVPAPAHCAQKCLLWTACTGSFFFSLPLGGLDVGQVVLVTATFALLAASEARAAWVTGDETRVWTAKVVAIGYLAYLYVQAWFVPNPTVGMFALIGWALVAGGLSQWSARRERGRVFAWPLEVTSLALPALAVGLGALDHFLDPRPIWLGANSLALLVAAAIYYFRGLERDDPRWIVLAAVILNLACWLLWGELEWSDPQFYAIPMGLSLIALARVLERHLPPGALVPLRYAGALCILVAPIPHILGGSWVHILSLMVVAVCVLLLGLGLKTRALAYTGSAFLVVDLVAMVARGTVDQPSLLWIAGVALGLAVVILAAVCERHREQLAQRLRLVAATLETWNG